MNMQPIGNRIVVRRVEPKETAKGGLVIPDIAQEKPQEAVVLAVGPGKRTGAGERVPMSVAEGDHVLLGKHGGMVCEVDGEELLVVREDDLFAVLMAS